MSKPSKDIYFNIPNFSDQLKPELISFSQYRNKQIQHIYMTQEQAFRTGVLYRNVLEDILITRKNRFQIQLKLLAKNYELYTTFVSGKIDFLKADCWKGLGVVLKNNTQIVYCNLSYSGINDFFLKDFLKYLKGNTTIKYLNLSYCNIKYLESFQDLPKTVLKVYLKGNPLNVSETYEKFILNKHSPPSNIVDTYSSLNSWEKYLQKLKKQKN